ncbi:MAG: tRNA guanosine(34) transglycosylase Tgt [Candidatus Brocadiae bacterium]|nr:tRNA guanosine(34) transglycosylase Tgt [Candidatus Brocadiia bacterium]
MVDKKKFQFTLECFDASGTQARLGKIETAHGSFPTPVFMPVGTRAVVKTMTPQNIKDTGAKIILGNTYHLAVRPGEKYIQEMGKLHRFMAWDGSILTDSGGFQVLSLADLRKISNKGVVFRSHINGDLYEFTPEKVIEIQQCLGSDIMMPLDHCVACPATHDEAKEAAERSILWLKRSKAVPLDENQVLFGIVQGSVYADLREWCAKEMKDLDMPGYSIGGLAVGESKKDMFDMLEVVNAILPIEKPRYLMGVGTPEDIVNAVSLGTDMFDCVMPTRNARGGGAFTWKGKIQIRNSHHRESLMPLEPRCQCYCCRTFSRAYLHHLFSKGVEEIMGLTMLSLHNLTFYQDLTAAIRKSIKEGNFKEFKQDFLAQYQAGSE